MSKKTANFVCFIIMIAALCLLVFSLWSTYIKTTIPDKFTLVQGESADVFQRSSVNVKKLNAGSHKVDFKLFGIPIKSVDVDVVERKMLIPCGTPVGIYMETEGVLVIDIVEIIDCDGNKCLPANGVLMKGDYVISANEISVNDKNQLTDIIASSNGSDVILKINRNGMISEVKLKPVKTGDGTYKAGIWVRDNTQGIGMMTYVTMDGNFAALGHGIHDADTEVLMDLSRGFIFQSNILEIVKSNGKVPGELVGSIYYHRDSLLGSISKNTECGIYGKVSDNVDLSNATPLQVGYKQDIKKGPATIITTINGSPCEYKIEILSIELNTTSKSRGLVIQITDENLIKLTGGIVQGMSGSPIIQGGKIIGAVTHVLVNDSTKGYGIFAETMLEQE